MSIDLANDIRGYVIFACLVIGILLALYLLIAVPVALFGVREKRCVRLKRAAQFGAAVFVTTAGAWFLADYGWKATLRPTAYACHSEVSDFDNGKYLAMRCGIYGGYDYLRVYDTQTKQLLADRTYRCIGDHKIIMDKYLGKAMVFDACADDDSAINLPPSLLDRLRAKLP